MRVTIDDNSGFCFGVVRAIDVAEESLRRVGDVYSLGDIVHNRIEVQRLEELGLHTVTAEDMEQLGGKTLLIRAHGEPPRTYARAEALGIDIVDAT
jgi:4-hydroxy-3-methylbut-2-enyl diphosphate reductase